MHELVPFPTLSSVGAGAVSDVLSVKRAIGSTSRDGLTAAPPGTCFRQHLQGRAFGSTSMDVLSVVPPGTCFRQHLHGRAFGSTSRDGLSAEPTRYVARTVCVCVSKLFGQSNLVSRSLRRSLFVSRSYGRSHGLSSSVNS